ncbi:MAG: LysR family transcriptional regulator [Lachnospiraceae bacterium]
MTIDQVRFFAAIIEYGTYHEAAEQLGISQSSLSKQIINLENELNVKLFHRQNRTVNLTEAGEVFYRHAQTLLSDYHHMRTALSPYSNTMYGVLTIGTLPILSQYEITTCLRQFMEEHPKVTVEIEEVEDEELLRGLRYGKYDFAIARDGMIKNQEFPVTLLAHDYLVLLVSRSHPMAGAETVKLEDLKEEQFILMHSHISVHGLAVSACQDAGYHPQVIRTARIESIIDAVRIGEGVSLLCEKQVNAFKLDEVALLRLHTPVAANVVIVNRLKPPEHVRKIIKYLKKQSGIDS